MGIAAQGGVNRLQEQRDQQNQFANYLQQQQSVQTNALAGSGTSAANYANAQLQQNNATNQLNSGNMNAVGTGLATAYNAYNKNPSGNCNSSSPSPSPSDGTGYVGGSYNFTDNSASIMKAHGGLIEGPEVEPGDHPANDVVPAKLSSGEIVIPKSIVEKGGKAAGAFVDALKAHYENHEKIKKMSYGDVLAARKGK